MRRSLFPSATASLTTSALAGLALATAVAATATAAAPAAPGGGTPDLGETVTGAAVYEHLEAFSDIAAANGGNRAVGTPGYEAGAAYVEQVLRDAGYEPERQYFDVETYTVTGVALDVADLDLAPAAFEYAPATPAGGLTAELVTPADPLGCDAAAWSGVEATGRIAVVSRGTCSFAEKSVAAGAAGASALVIANNVDEPLTTGTLGGTAPENVPTVGVSQSEGAAVLELVAAGPVTATLDLQASVESVETFNVLAETTTGRDDNVVMVGAHLDGVEDGPGINDNGSGSAAILETAVQLAEAGPLNNQVRFAWWGAEEIGLLGSTHYVDDLVATAPDEVESIATYLNFDMVGSPNYTVGVYDADESTYEAPVAVPEGSIATEAVFTDYFDGVGQPWVDSEFSGRSDYQAFILNGIPASGLFTGADGVKTEEEAAIFGGTAGELLDPNYHTPADDLANVSLEALDIMSPAIGHAVQSLAESTETVNGVPATPAWSADTTYGEGDLVLLDGRTFQALWWTRNQEPGASPYGPWAEVGAPVTCGEQTVATWTPSWVYSGGETVAYDGQLFTAKWWTRNQAPGDQYGPWEPAGTC
ncbi:M20/M25/M40 family metallo-hydrolase [Nocardioides alkalitolerans]|uniref:M20/M25/M40 family metallo-hydrolase n=1 Tax=Nocardioides alkalitolerans TaxID=281714 RepID=UPI00040A0DEA|nr:M20/M25/M40 family metallo-hydrolase [Nocardioides alkalitolerans]